MVETISLLRGIYALHRQVVNTRSSKQKDKIHESASLNLSFDPKRTKKNSETFSLLQRFFQQNYMKIKCKHNK